MSGDFSSLGSLHCPLGCLDFSLYFQGAVAANTALNVSFPNENTGHPGKESISILLLCYVLSSLRLATVFIFMTFPLIAQLSLLTLLVFCIIQ